MMIKAVSELDFGGIVNGSKGFAFAMDQVRAVTCIDFSGNGGFRLHFGWIEREDIEESFIVKGDRCSVLGTVILIVR